MPKVVTTCYIQVFVNSPPLQWRKPVEDVDLPYETEYGWCPTEAFSQQPDAVDCIVELRRDGNYPPMRVVDTDGNVLYSEAQKPSDPGYEVPR